VAYAPRELTPNSPRPLLDLPAVCSLLGVSLPTAYKLLREGALPSYKVGASWRFDELEIRAALRAQPGERWVQGPRKQPDKTTVPA